MSYKDLRPQTVEDELEKMAAGETSEQLLAAYPQIEVEDWRACLEYAAALAADEVVLTEA